jgi:drug/metabolite transporter (DMT)-like permease
LHNAQVKKLQATFERWPRNARGAMWMLASAVTFTMMTTLIKYLGDDYPAALQTFYRQAASLIVLLPIIVTKPRAVFATTRPGILIFRAAAGTVGVILSFYAYQKMPLAEANALSFTRALWLVPLAAFVLGEKVGLGRVVATIIGFGGVLLMLVPSIQDVHFGLSAAAALTASLLMAFTITGHESDVA